MQPQPILKSQIWDIIRDYGFPVRTVPAERYLEEVLDSDDELFLRGLQSVIVYLGDYEKSPPSLMPAKRCGGSRDRA